MGGYEENMFIEWLDLARIYPAEHLYEEMCSEERPENWSDEFLSKRLGFAEDIYEHHFRKFSELKLTQKLRKEAGFNQALRAIRGGRRGNFSNLPVLTSGTSKEDAVLKVLKAFRTATVPSDAVHELRACFIRSAANGWHFHFVQAFHEYLFTENAERLYEARKDGKHQFERLLVAANSLDRLIDSLGSERMFEVREIPRWKWLKAKLESSLHGGMIFDTLPINRDSKLKREQLFVYRMYRANKRATRYPKPAVIADLMTIEGFKHQFDLRHIERMCAAFSPAKKAE